MSFQSLKSNFKKLRKSDEENRDGNDNDMCIIDFVQILPVSVLPMKDE